MKPQVLDEEHEAFRNTCRRFARDHIAPRVVEWEEAEAFPVELYRQAGELGILGASLDERYGGSGGDKLFALVAIEGLMEGGSAGVVAGLQSLGIALPPIFALGTEAQKQAYCAPACRGEKIAALAITEPGTGSDVAGITTRARRDGDRYVLSGSKTFITSGARADVVTVLARTGDDPHGGLTFFVVERGMEGFHCGEPLKKTGWWASDTAELFFDDVSVPIENRIGAEGSGFVALMQNFENERLMLAVNGLALATVALEEAVAYAQERKAFGRPIAKHQVIKHKLARMATQVASCRALTYAVADRMRAGESVLAEVAMAKNHAAEVAREVCWEAVQVFGGMGYMRETAVERISRDARLLPIGGGTQEIMKEIVVKALSL